MGKFPSYLSWLGLMSNPLLFDLHCNLESACLLRSNQRGSECSLLPLCHMFVLDKKWERSNFLDDNMDPRWRPYSSFFFSSHCFVWEELLELKEQGKKWFLLLISYHYIPERIKYVFVIEILSLPPKKN